jgi:hypothetical protein
MRKLTLTAFSATAILSSFPAFAQTSYPSPGGGYVNGNLLMCLNSSGNAVPCNATTPLAIAGTFSATLGGFQPASVGTPITATTGGATGTLPVGTVVVATNVGSTNSAYCALGATSSTSQQLIPPGAWFAFTVGAATQLTCVSSASTTTVNMVGGSGLPTGSGGGGGGGSGGTVTQGTAAAIGSAWPVYESLGGAVISATNPVPLSFGTGVTLPAFTSTPTVNLGTLNGAALETGGNLASVATNTTRTNAGTTASNALPVQGVTGGVALPISGTVTLGTGSNTAGKVDVLGNGGAALDVAIGGATAAAGAMQVAGVYVSTPPTLTTGQGGALLLDANARQVVVPAPYGHIPLSPEQHNLSLASSTALTVPTGATYATVCARTAEVEYTWDGTTTPTTAPLGFALAAGTCVPLEGATVLANFRAISPSGGTIDVGYAK